MDSVKCDQVEAIIHRHTVRRLKQQFSEWLAGLTGLYGVRPQSEPIVNAVGNACRLDSSDV